MSDDAVTVVVGRRPRPGREAELRDWAEGVVAVAAGFPGHLGARIYPPVPPEQPEQVLAFSFASRADLDRWMSSAERADWMARVEPLAEETTVQRLTGFEGWFGDQDRSPVVPPPRWKTAVLVAVAIYPLALLTGAVVQPLLGGLPLPVRTLVTTAVLVPAMTWVVVPALSRLLRRWLTG